MPIPGKRTPPASAADIARPGPRDLQLSIHKNLSAIESEWRRFERDADCTAFQTFDWLAAWQRQVGQRNGTMPAIVVGNFASGATAFILPLAIEPKRSARRLCWLGQELCDYNAPLLAPDFSQRVGSERFLAAWRELLARMQFDPQLRPDWVELEKMPQTLGEQINPLTYIDVTPNPSGAHIMRLGSDWQKFYFEKRSSATRRHDRSKRQRMAACGDIRFINCADVDDARHTVEILIEQKSRALVRNGIPDIFTQPGYREFFLDLAADPKTKSLVHVSRIEIGPNCAAANFALVFGDCYYHVLASFDDGLDVSRYGPGALHLRELMAHAIALGLRRFDFTIGDERYKLEWSDIHVKLYDHAAATTWRGWTASRVSLARRRLKRFIKQTPVAWRLVGRIRPAFAALWHRHS